MKAIQAVLVLILLLTISQLASSKDHYPSNVTEMIQQKGYPCEDHLTPPTSDGWQLSLQRIPHGRFNQNATRKGVVLFQHGLTDTSVGVNLNSLFESLSYILADNGYDVWMGNNRGNGVSMTNVLYDKHSKEFWDFSWDEMAQIDLPANIAYVLEQTGQKQLTYIGHSEGTIQAFAGFVHNNSLANSVNLYVALAPVAYVQHVESIILQVMAKFHVDDLFTLLGIEEFYLPNAIHQLLPGICDITPNLCAFVVDLLCGPTTYFNHTRISYYSRYEPNPTSVKNMVHWSQGVSNGKFEMFDYGSHHKNKEHYGQDEPPQYDLTLFPKNLPTALFTGGEDYLADPKDVQKLISLLPTPPYVHNEPDYAHLDPLLGINAYQRIYPLILSMLNNVWVEEVDPFTGL